jgi:RND family efflux transporter MFP subunit
MIIFLLTIIFACSDSTGTASNNTLEIELRQSVRTEVVEKKVLSQNLVLPTTLEAEQSAILVPKVQGRIEGVFVRIGDQVAEGTPLLEIEASDYFASYKETKMAMMLIETQMEQAKRTLERFKKLLEEQAITKSQYEEVEMGAKLAEGQYDRAKIGFDIASSRLTETKLKAPFDGTIIARNVEVGEMLSGNIQQPPIMIADLRKIRFIAAIGESTVSSVSKDSKAFLKVLNQEPFPVQITRINQAVDPVTRTVQIEGLFDNSTYKFIHGQSAQLTIKNAQEIIAIDRKALLNRKDQTADVFVLLGDNTVQKKTIRYGRSDNGLVPVLAGLIEGEQILVAGQSRLKDGDSVIIASEQAQ